MACLAAGEITYRGRKLRVSDPMIGTGGDRPEAPLYLVFALGAGVKARQTLGDTILDALVVARFEMQGVKFMDTAPVATEQGVLERKYSAPATAWSSR